MSSVTKNDAFDYGKIGTAGALIVYLVSNISPKLDAIHDAQIQQHADLVLLTETVREFKQNKNLSIESHRESDSILLQKLVAKR